MSDDISRSTLPIPDPEHEPRRCSTRRILRRRSRRSSRCGRPRARRTSSIVLLDDVGFGASSAFGGPCATPTAERLAGGGLKYNRFHTTALCSPTRAALLVGPQPPHGRHGRHHRDRDLGARLQLDAPEHVRAARRDAEAERLLDRAVRQVPRGARCGRRARWARSTAGRRGGGGFEYFYGFIGGETNQYYPAIYEGTTPIEPEQDAGGGLPLHRGHDRQGDRLGPPAEGADARQAVLRLLRAGRDARAAPRADRSGRTSTRAGSTRAGTRCARRPSRARRSSASSRPDAELTARHEEIPAWDDMPDELKPVLARQMEVYAGFLEHTDHHVGRLVDALDDLGVLEDTLVYYVIGDNGATRRGHGQRARSTRRSSSTARPRSRRPSSWRRSIDEFGTPTAYNHYAVGWAHAMDTPYQWTKQVASHWGGTRNGTIVHWPHGHRGARRGARRSSTT